ncbi:hypothetical protein A8B82_16775 [Sulfitobacter sp. EhC04]|uniref:hypothetical protein n=1 Tax=Sulfitobacter sp. EhC04 TaxID=1849168 RepID=UPI0007F53CCF|nr:hypothetical protein [Sulfitobacter sp. EhC04]OAN75235.1 hypothetical protein A8B82_16775 [Sulfitobacter sp. EhC04]
MKFIKSLAVGLAVLAGVGPVQAAKGFTLECNLKQLNTNGGFGDRMYLSFVEGWTNPAAFDGAIMELHEVPIPINLISNEGKRVRFDWELKGLKFRDGTSIGRVIYKGSVDKKTLHIRMESIVPSNVGRYFTEGQCKKIK